MIDINEKLLDELKTRNIRFLIPHFAVTTISFLVLKKLQVFSPEVLLPFLTIFFSLFLRLFIVKKCFHKIKKNQLIPWTAFLFSVILNGLSWGYLLYETQHFYGVFTIESFYCVTIIVILMASGVTTFSSSIKTALSFITSLAFFPILILSFDPEVSTPILGCLLFGNLFYQYFHVFVTHKYLKTALMNESLALSQKESLQDFIDALPGLVLAIDENHTYSLVNNFQNGLYKKLFLGRKVGGVSPNSEFLILIHEFLNSNDSELVREIKSDFHEGESWWMVKLRRMNMTGKMVVVAVLPITDTVRARDELKIQEARSQYAAKLASVGELSASIAHEVNNPLTIIEGAANLMKFVLADEPVDHSALRRATEKIMETTQRIAKIIKSLRTLSGSADAEPFQNISFSSIVEPSIEISKAKLREHNIELKVHKSSEEISLFGNEIQLSQVIMNLISNAIDAVKEVEGEKWIHVHYETSIKWLDILIVDNGPGISSEIREKIMEPFFSTKISNQGTGLGLSISKNIVGAHNGILSILPDTSHTTFRIRFPRMALDSSA